MVIGSNPIKCLKILMFISNNIILYILILPVLGVFHILLSPTWNKKLLKKIALFYSCLTFLISLFLWILFNKSIGTFQFLKEIIWIPSLNLNFTVGIDGISLFFLLLTTFLIPLCLLIHWNTINSNLKEYLISFLLMDFLLIGVFCVLDILLFYVFFESVLVPMFLIIGFWGSRERKIRAAYFFFFFIL